MADAVPGAVADFAKQLILSTEPGAAPLNAERMKDQIRLADPTPEQLQMLLFAAIETGHLDIVRFLIEDKHVDPNHLYRRHFEMKDGKVGIKPGMAPTPVLYVILTTYFGVPKERLTQMFLYLVEKVNPDIIKFRLRTNNPRNESATILHYLSSRWALQKFDTIPIVRALCEKVPDLINMQSAAGETALHIAASGNVEMVRELIRLGADVTIRDNVDKTPRDTVPNTPRDTVPSTEEDIPTTIRKLLDSALNPAAPPGSPPRGPGAGAGGSPPPPASPASPPYIGSPSDPQAPKGGRRRTRRKRSKRKSRRHRVVKY